METAELIKSLGEKLGVELMLDEDGVCAFEADGMAVTIHDLHELSAIALVGDLGEPPPEHLETLYQALLEANHLFGGTAGATLSRDSATGRFALCRALPCLALDAESFYTAVERFLNTLEVWSKVIRDFRSVVPNAAEADISVPALDMNKGGFLRV